MHPFFRSLGSLPAATLSMKQWGRLTSTSLFLPFYHTVSSAYLPHVAPLYRYRSEKEFSGDMDILLRNFQPVSLSEVYQTVSTATHFPKPSFFLSFDDGLKEIEEIVAPILWQKGIPATVFVNPDFVGNKHLFFRYKAALLVDCLDRMKAPLPPLPFLSHSTKAADWRKWILSARYEHIPQLDSLAQTLGVDFGQFLDTQRPYLDISQLHALKSKGWDIGSHSMDHPEYRFLSFHEQVKQTVQSLAWVKDQGLESIPAFAFPFTDFGVSHALYKEVDRILPSPLFFGTAGLKTEQNKHHLQRIPMEGTTWEADRLIKGEFFSFFIKKILGKNLIKRV